MALDFIGQQFGDYRLTDLLGRGRFAETYLGKHIFQDQKAAIRIITIGTFGIEGIRERASLLKNLHHPNIIRLLDFGKQPTEFLVSYLFEVSQYTSTETLRQRMPQGTHCSIEQILPYVKQIAEALQHAHNHMIIHQQVSPQKMYFAQNNHILLKFNVVLSEDLITFMMSMSRFTLYRDRAMYMAPEQFRGQFGKVPLPAIDQYSLGVTVYEWLIGQPPFTQGDEREIGYQHVHEHPPSLRSKNPSTPKAVEDVVMKALAKKPEDRFESIQAFADALERAYQPPKPIFRPNDLLNQQFGDYQLKRQLGSGSLGDVYLAEHVSLGSKAAVKIFREPIEAGEFRNKVRRLARLQHPNIVRVLESGIEHGKPFLVLDYAPYGSLYTRHRASKVPLSIVVEYVKQAASGLQEIHDHNMVLGALRPTDILLDDNDEVLLDNIDAVFAEENILQGVGTYTAPEQLNGTILPASDQYALALIAYELLSGKRLTRREILGPHATPLVSLKTLVPELSQEVADVIAKALAKDPKQRFPSVEDFARALEEASVPKDESIAKPRNRMGQQFGKYQLIKILGRGGFADVYLGKHIEMETFAAIKVLHAQLTDEYAPRFQTEARTIAQLKHQYIVRVLHFGVQDEIPYLVMDQAKATLRDIHPRGSVLSPKVILPYVKQIAAALQYAHDQRRIHRDIKPENMLLGPRNEVLLSDFGLATIVNTATVQNTKNIAGTAMYMSPEQFKGKAGFASDQYALGIVVYEWLCGETPFTEGDFIQLGFQHSYEPPPPMHEKVASISSEK